MDTTYKAKKTKVLLQDFITSLNKYEYQFFCDELVKKKVCTARSVRNWENNKNPKLSLRPKIQKIASKIRPNVTIIYDTRYDHPYRAKADASTPIP